MGKKKEVKQEKERQGEMMTVNMQRKTIKINKGESKITRLQNTAENCTRQQIVGITAAYKV